MQGKEDGIEAFRELPPHVLERIHLNFYLERVKWQGLRHLRRFATRLIDASGGYSDLCVGPHEFRELAGAPSEAPTDVWLEIHGIPQLIPIHDTLEALEYNLRFFLDSLTETQQSALPIERLRNGFDLTDDELQMLMVVVAPGLNIPLSRFLTVIWADFAQRLPTAGFVARMVSRDEDHFGALLEQLSDRARLVQMRLLIPEPSARWPRTPPRIHAPLSVDQPLIDVCLGVDLSANLSSNAILHTEAPKMSDLFAQPEFVTSLSAVLSGAHPRILLTGPLHSGRRTLIQSYSQHTLHQPTLELDLADILTTPSSQGSPLPVRVAEVLREALLLGATLLLRFDVVSDRDTLKGAIRSDMRSVGSLFKAFPGAVIVTAPERDRFLDALLASPVELRVPGLAQEAQIEVWKHALVGTMPQDRAQWIAETCANNYQLPVGSILSAVERAREAQNRIGKPSDDLQSHHILAQIRATFDHNLGVLADVVVVETRLADVIMPAKVRKQIEEVLHFARHAHVVFDDWGLRSRSPYGNALSVLLSGPPGTGKTLLASGLANELGKVLYRVDLSRVVDKFIGETEKNLGRIFDEAGRAQAVLLFDEADSLFANRTEVKSSNDRYANLEVNYLLQRLESYEGVSILTTNLARGIDEAFQRRIRFCIDFPMPDQKSRTELWRHLVPPRAPLSDDIDWELLGESFEMSGGHIRNATLRASVQAASLKQPLDLDILLRAGVNEAREMGNLIKFGFEFEPEDDDDEFS